MPPFFRESKDTSKPPPLFASSPGSFILALSRIELVAKGEAELAGIEFVDLGTGQAFVVDALFLDELVEEVVAAQLDGQGVVEEGFAERDVQHGPTFPIGVLLVAACLVTEVGTEAEAFG